MMTIFPCTQCGACCASIEGIDFLMEYNQNGRCRHLVNHLCDIYDERPLLCRIDEAYEQIFSAHMTKEDYYEANAKACNLLQEQKKIDVKYRVLFVKNRE